MSKLHSTKASFGYAIEGLKTAVKQEPNFQLHLIIGLIAIAMGVVFRLSGSEWFMLTLTISFVIIMELVNTSLEALVNIASPEKHPQAKIAKDVAAASVLISAVFSLIAGIIIFLPKILDLLII